MGIKILTIDTKGIRLFSNRYLRFVDTKYARYIFQNIFLNDLIFIGSGNIWECYQVVDKSLDFDLEIEHPYLLLLSPIKIPDISLDIQEKWSRKKFIWRRGDIGEYIYRKMKGVCFQPTKVFDRIPLIENDKYKIYLAASKKENARIKEISVFHPFGYVHSDFHLVCYDNLSLRIISSVGFGKQKDFSPRHTSQMEIFGSSYSSEIAKFSVFVNRLYSSKNHSLSTRELYYNLLKTVIEYGYKLYRDKFVLEGVSYLYVPVAQKLQINCSLPKKRFSSFYYWYLANQKDKKYHFPSVQSIRRILINRQSSKWVVNGQYINTSISLEKKSLALLNTSSNKGRWLSLRKGDHLIVIKRDKSYSIFSVYKKVKRNIKNNSDYPYNILLGTEHYYNFHFNSLKELQGGLLSIDEIDEFAN